MKIVIQNLQKRIPIDPKKIKESVLRVLQIEKIKKTGQINFFFTSDNKIRGLNLRYRGLDCATDVLSFDISRSPSQILADIVISVDTARRNAKLFHTSTQYEIYLYVIHGILHILGYNDRSKRERQLIQRRQEDILRVLQLPHLNCQITYATF